MIEDMAVFFGDVGVLATCGGVTARVLYDAPGSLALDRLVSDAGPQITFATAEWPALRAGDAIIVSGVSYTAREVLPLDDGALSVARLRRA